MNIEKKILGNAAIQWDGKIMSVSNGTFRREWALTDCGLATSLLENNGKKWVETTPAAIDCDWHLFMLVSEKSKAELTGMTIETVENPPLTSPHIAAAAEFTYEKLILRYSVQVFPGAPGVRTCLSVMALYPFSKEEFPGYLMESYAESLYLPAAEYTRHAVGYYNDLQRRSHNDTPVMKEEKNSGDLSGGKRELYDWANILSIESADAGFMLVKESHKCVNQAGIDTGAFVLHSDAIRVTGLGYQSTEFWLPHDRFREAWAAWCVPYSGGEEDRQLALKRFDRACFMPHPEKSLYSRSNTWGTRYPGAQARGAAKQGNILNEISTCAELGIDVLAIDDGWQCNAKGDYEDDSAWEPHLERFPNGWEHVRKAAEKAGVELHLWMPGASVTLEDMIRNIEQGGFTGMKIDFLHLHLRELLDDVVTKVERLVKYSGYNFQISWDVTENAPRLGYFYARQFGSLHIANRKPTFSPAKRVNHIAYCPRLILRDVWQIAHYINLNHIEIPIQDVSKIDPEISNASLYPQTYCLAIALAGLPLFFLETNSLPQETREPIRNLLELWQRHRQNMGRSYVFPLGDEPDDRSWTGFQWHDTDTEEGYVLLFRELEATESETVTALRFLKDKALAWQDIETEESWTDEQGTGNLRCRIESKPGFRWLHYRPLSPVSQ